MVRWCLQALIIRKPSYFFQFIKFISTCMWGYRVTKLYTDCVYTLRPMVVHFGILITGIIYNYDICTSSSKLLKSYLCYAPKCLIVGVQNEVVQRPRLCRSGSKI